MTGAIVTPTFAGDLERTRLFVESHQRTGAHLPLVLVVQTEDRPLFRGVSGDNVVLMNTADVLPARLEQRRRNRHRRRDPRRYLRGQPIHGWTSQQIVKLLAPSVLGVDVVFCMDSDVALLAPLTLADATDANGSPLLFETRDDNALTLSWAIDSMRALGVDLAHATLRQYVHQGVLLHRETCDRLFVALASHTGQAWWEVFLQLGLTEYQTYGVFAREVDVESALSPGPPLDILTYWVHPSQDLVEDLRERLTTSRPLGVCVQSALHIAPPDYRTVLETLWR